VLKHVTTSIANGQTLAVVGPTGCGKTTLIELLARVYDPPRGSIYVDGHPIQTIPLKVLRRDMVLVPQDIFLFSETIADNIRLGNPESSLESVMKQPASLRSMTRSWSLNTSLRPL
jgi:ATP-binding cassette subfamily B protein